MYIIESDILLFSNGPKLRQKEHIYNVFTYTTIVWFLRLAPVPNMQNGIICVSIFAHVRIICIEF